MLCTRHLQRTFRKSHAIALSAAPCLLRAAPVGPTSQSPSTPSSSSRVLTRTAASSTRWKTRQANDHFAKEARVAGLKSRAAFKLLELDARHRIFRKGGTVIDLGYAPGSWSQVAVNRTSPGGRVVGIDVIPAQPPRGASSIQGNFLSAEVQAEVRNYVRDYWRGRARKRGFLARSATAAVEDEEEGGVAEDEVDGLAKGIVDLGRETLSPATDPPAEVGPVVTKDDNNPAGDVSHESKEAQKDLDQHEKDERDGRVVDVVLSDMSAPWELITGTWIRSVNNPYRRMMNTSGMAFRDHAGSMVNKPSPTCSSQSSAFSI